MTSARQGSRYPGGAIALHWVMLALIIAVYACILLRENYPRGSDIREGLKTWHYMLGLSVLALAAVRVALQLFVWKKPPITPPPPRWQSALGGAVHLALYGLMLLMPVGGWLILSASGDAIPFWGLSLPPLASASESFADQIKEIHETGGTIGYFLIGLHAAASLAHHYILRDDTLVRMLPGRAR